MGECGGMVVGWCVKLMDIHDPKAVSRVCESYEFCEFILLTNMSEAVVSDLDEQNKVSKTRRQQASSLV